MSLSERDLKVIKQILNSLSTKFDFIVLINQGDIFQTTISEFKNQKHIEMPKMFQYMNDTSDKYFYQLSSPLLENKKHDILFITRLDRNQSYQKDRFSIIINWILPFILVFEIFCTILTIIISNTISKSITLLNKNTEQIANGNLDVKLDYEKNTRKDNEITALTANLDKMRLTLKDESERRIKFIMGISHDLRTPVAVIKGYTEAMSEGLCDTPEETKKSLKIISAKTAQLETMINTLINFVKLNQTNWLQQLKKQKIAPVINEFVQTSITTGEVFKRNVKAHVKISGETELAFDKTLVQRAFENLFSNAVRYTNENDQIEITAEEDEKRILFKIKDSGIGISKEDKEKIFDMFYRASSSRREEGMGIGLATVMTIIKAHGWKISVESELGKGSEFTIEMPL